MSFPEQIPTPGWLAGPEPYAVHDPEPKTWDEFLDGAAEEIRSAWETRIDDPALERAVRRQSIEHARELLDKALEVLR